MNLRLLDDNWQDKLNIDFDLPQNDIQITDEIQRVNIRYAELLNTDITLDNVDYLIQEAVQIQAILAQLYVDIESFGESLDNFMAHVRNVSNQLACDKEEYEYMKNSLYTNDSLLM